MRKFLKNHEADARMVGILVAVLIVIVRGTLVFWEITGAIRLTSTQGIAVQSKVNETATTVFQLAPIIAIVMIASIILGIVTTFGKGGGGV